MLACARLPRTISLARRGMGVITARSVRTQASVGDSSALQRLLNRARDLAGHEGAIQLSMHEAQELGKLASEIPLEELGLSSKAVEDPDSVVLPSDKRLRDSLPLVQYQHIFEDDRLSIGIFSFPTGGIELPLHDHPGMTVISRLLYGSLDVQSYDWLPGSGSSSSAPGLQTAQLMRDGVLSAPAAPLILFPSEGGNIHRFRSVTPCAVLDILTPPYAPKGGRDCTYFAQRTAIRSEGGSKAAELEVIEEPADFGVARKPYAGVAVRI